MTFGSKGIPKVLLSVLLLSLGLSCSCTSMISSVKAKGKETMTISDWKKVSFGRSDLMVPANAHVAMKGEVNEVELVTSSIAEGKSLDTEWKARLGVIGSGKGWPNGQTSIKKQYPGLHQVYYATGNDPDMLVNLERWVQVGPVLVKAVTEFNPKYLAEVERNMDNLFAHLVSGGTPRAGDFVIDSLIVSLPMDGRESVDATIDFDVPANSPSTNSHVTVTVSEEALKTPGNITVLSRISEAKLGMEGLKVQVLRSGPLRAGNLEGEESILSFAKVGTGQGGIRAEWGSGGLPNTQKAPQSSITMVAQDTAHPDMAALTGCWDHLISSLSFR